MGVFNMLLTDSSSLYCYCSTKLSWITRQAPFDKATLKDDEFTVDFEKETTPADIVTIIATDPLTDNETWNQLYAGQMVVFRDGTLTQQIT